MMLFNQINDLIKTIDKQSKWSISFINRFRLIRLTKKHDLIAKKLFSFNLIIRRTCLVFFICIALMQVIPLNIYLKSDNWFEKSIILIYIIFTFLNGFIISYYMSFLITITHKPYKTIYKLIRKSKPSLEFKWKVI